MSALRRLGFRLAVLLAAASPASLAAQTFVVDAANGPGAHFTTIAAATLAVPDGATVVVRAGSYVGFTIAGKGMTILGEPGANVTSPGGLLTGSFQVVGTSPTQPVAVRGLRLTDAFGSVLLSSCQGSVLLEAIDSQAFCNCSNMVPATFQVFACAQVLVRDCTARGASLFQTHAVFEGCTLNGYGAICALGQCSLGFPAISANQGSTQVSSCLLQGGVGGGGGFYPLVPNQPAILATGGSLRVLGPSTLIAGDFPGAPPVPAVSGSAGVVIDPAVVATTIHPTPVVGASVVAQPMPTVRSRGGVLGGTMRANALGPIGDLAVLVVGLPGAVLALPGFDAAFWLDAAAHQFAAIGVPQSGQPLAATLVVPAVPVFLGFRIAWQAVSLSGGALRTSNPTLALVH